MEFLTNLNWYRFDQNNPGGSFEVDENVSHIVYIQASSAKSANNRADDIYGMYFDGVESGRDCSCCGSRWYRADERDIVTDIDKDIQNYMRYGLFSGNDGDHVAVMYYANGNKVLCNPRINPELN
jgi:hypothetical protein